MDADVRMPAPPPEFLNGLTDVSDRAAAGYGWQAGYLAGLQAAALTPPAEMPAGFDPVRAPAAVAKLYVLAALDEVTTALAAARAKYTTDLSGDRPFTLLLAAERVARRTKTNSETPT